MRVGEARRSISPASLTAARARFPCAIGWLALVEIPTDYSTNGTPVPSTRTRENDMSKRWVAAAFAVLAGFAATAARADEAADLFAKFKAASGGAAWDSIATLESKGTLSVGG